MNARKKIKNADWALKYLLKVLLPSIHTTVRLCPIRPIPFPPSLPITRKERKKKQEKKTICTSERVLSTPHSSLLLPSSLSTIRHPPSSQSSSQEPQEPAIYSILFFPSSSPNNLASLLPLSCFAEPPTNGPTTGWFRTFCSVSWKASICGGCRFSLGQLTC